MTRSDNDVYRLFCDEGWKGSENKIFYIYIYIFSMVNFYFIRSRKE